MILITRILVGSRQLVVGIDGSLWDRTEKLLSYILGSLAFYLMVIFVAAVNQSLGSAQIHPSCTVTEVLAGTLVKDIIDVDCSCECRKTSTLVNFIEAGQCLIDRKSVV